MATNGSTYTIQGEAKRIFELILHDPRLNAPSEVKALESTVSFVGEETQPFYPVPFKAAEAQAGLCGYLGLLANAISKQRYGTEQEVVVDVYELSPPHPCCCKMRLPTEVKD